MAIDYLAESEKYRPGTIETLLVGEAPPPNGNTYFYVPTDLRNSGTIRGDRSLPATIFCHYFRRRPEGRVEYEKYLEDLREMGVFLVDIYDDPIKVRGSDEAKEKIIDAIPTLGDRLIKRGIDIERQRTIFLLARNGYEKHIRKQYPFAEQIRWIDFRMANIEEET